MKLLFYYESSDLGGQQTQTLNLIKSMKGHEAYFAYNKKGALLPAFEAATKVFGLSQDFRKGNRLGWPKMIYKSSSELTKIIKAEHIDVIISGSGFGSLIAGIAAKRSRIFHHRIMGCSMQQVERLLFRTYKYIKLDLLIQHYYGLGANLDELRLLDVPDSKLVKIPNGVNTDQFYPLPVDVVRSKRHELGIKDDEFVIGWVGRIAEGMQVKYTVAMAELLKNNTDKKFKLLIVGGGDWENELHARINQAGLSDCTICVGWQPMASMNNWINCMDIVPLLEEDPIGGSILREAMACGRVVVSVDGASNAQSEFIRNGKTGLLVNSESFLKNASNACVNLMENTQIFEQLGREARHFAVESMSFSLQADIIAKTCEAHFIN